MPSVDDLLPRYTRAQFTECVVDRTDLPIEDPEKFALAFGVLAFWDDQWPPQGKRFDFLTKDRVKLTKSHVLAITDSWMTAAEARTMLAGDPLYRNPAVPKGKAMVAAKGVWSGPVLVGQDEHPWHGCMPRYGFCYWVAEKWATSEAIRTWLGREGFEKMVEAVRKTLGVDLDKHVEHLGNLLVTFPETRVRMSISGGKAFERAGFELDQRTEPPTTWPVMVRAYRNNNFIGAKLVRVLPGLHVVDFGTEYDRLIMEVLDPESGDVIYRTGGHLLRHIGLTTQLTSAEIDATFNIHDPDGKPAKKPVRVKASFGHAVEAVTGEKDAPWIERPRLAALRAPTLHKVHLFRGGQDERERAMKVLEDFVQTRSAGYMKIWDPYFGPEDAAQWITRIFDRSLPIKVLTSIEPTPAEAGFRPPGFKKSAKQWKREKLTQVLGTIRQRGDLGLGFSNVTCRVHNRSHDRFVITRDATLILGCSFNQIGQVVSTMLEVRAPEIEECFDHCWDEAGPGSEL